MFGEKMSGPKTTEKNVLIVNQFWLNLIINSGYIKSNAVQ